MDFVSHGLWGGIAFGRTNRRSFILAAACGMLPDLVPFGPWRLAVFLGLAQRPPHHGWEPPDPWSIPTYVYRLYDLTHSLVVFLAVFAVISVLYRKPIWEICAWGLHVSMDIFTHSTRFFPTPFLWPISSVAVDGWPWGQSAIFVPNVILLALLYAWFWRHSSGARRRRS
ncbi:MAG: hypothetical protein C3F08_05095 [Candidatus Methylomirabilota bacterium]|nr:MAG: hypothetical protein C3F08_05095 [candidate division NC10 bacterium]